MPIRLTDSEFSIVLDHARPLAPDLHDQFMRAVAHALQGREIGPGLVGRTCREMQRNFFHPPATHGPGTLPKYR
jgi:hypothetical protein